MKDLILFKSTSDLLKKLEKLLDNDEISNGDIINIGIESRSPILSLYSLGRLLHIIRDLKYKLNINTCLTFIRQPSYERINNLRELGFFNYCESENLELNGIKISDAPIQDKLFKTFKPSSEMFKWKKKWWHCLVPLTTFNFDQFRDDRTAMQAANSELSKICNLIESRIDTFGSDFNIIRPEICNILFGLFKELISNSILHNQKNDKKECRKVLYALTLSQESSRTDSRAHTPGRIFEAGEPYFQLIVIDYGRGVLSSVISELDPNRDKQKIENYLEKKKWVKSQLFDTYKLEEDLLKSIFKGNLVIRKGRKSEGLHQLVKNLSWFDGTLYFRSGRNEVHIFGDPTSPVIESRPLRNHHPASLSGVNFSAAIPSTQMRIFQLKKHLPQRNIKNDEISIEPLTALPATFYKGQSRVDRIYLSEVYAVQIIQKFLKNLNEDSTFHFFEYNLRNSRAIDIPSFDNLIQELVKLSENRRGLRKNIFYGIFFSHVPISVINALKKRNCDSFLSLKTMFCVLLDEYDQPHFLGLTKTHAGVSDIDDCMRLIFLSGEVKEKQIRKILNPPNIVFEKMKNLLSTNKNDLFYYLDENGDITYYCHDILSAIEKKRINSLQIIKNCVGLKNENVIYKLSDKTYVDSVINFPLMWSDHECLYNYTRLLLAENIFPLTSTIISFINNGDLLGTEFQKQTNTQFFTVIDPSKPEFLSEFDFAGDYVLVIDAIYPGDKYHESELSLFIRNMYRNSFRSLAIFCALNFDDQLSKDELFISIGDDQSREISVPIFSLNNRLSITNTLQLVIPNSDHRVITPTTYYKCMDNNNLPECEVPADDHYIKNNRLFYNYVELSSEFWHNVCELRLISHHRTGREIRNNLFYENNEAIIRNQRTRELLFNFLSNYINNILESKIEIIMHPDHTVGAFLAQKVSEYLPNKPLVLLLPQPQYGGRIEITEDDFQQMALSVELKAKTINRRRPRLLILDDSVLSGSSLFTMLGIASNLNLNTKGVLVLLNRLSPEISESINLLPIKFAYLYRLHMPVPKSEEYPDLMLYNINNIYKKGSKSLIGLKWAHNLNEYEDESYFLKNVDKMIIDNIVLPEHERKKIETNNDQVYHIIQQLILNPDIGKIDIMTRVGIVFNFQEKLVTDDAFWNLLKILFEHGKDAENCFSSILFFLQKVIYILTFSKHTDSDKAHESFIRFCEDIVFASLNNNNWTNLVPIVCQCLMAMGIKKAPSLIRCLSCFSEEILLNALPSLDEDSLPKEDTESGSNKLKEKSAFQIVASYAWSLGILGLANDNQVFNNAKFKNIDEITNNINSIEERMLMIDLLQPSLDNNKSLRELLGINTWRFREKQLKLLLSKGENGNDNHILKYLKEAPGYYGILKSLIFLCKASTVLLYSKNKSETGFYLRVYETSFKKTPARDLKADDLTPEVIPRAIRTRMAAKLFFCSDSNDQIVSFIDKYTTGASHCACFGAPINTENDEIDYYILVGFTQLISPQHLSTAFYYWLRYEFLLRDILPAVHSKYVTSGTTWNAITQSITPIHTQTCIEDSARTVIRLATALLDLGTLLRRAVNLNTQSPIRLRDLWVIIHNISEVFIYEKITEAYELIRHFTNSPNMDQISMPFSIDKAKWPVRCNPLLASYFEKEVMISFPLAALEFVLYESICNSLSFFNKIDTSGDEKSIICRLSFDFKSKIPKISVSILNPYAPIQEECFTDRNQKGRIASDAAIRAIGGTYFSGGDINTKIWTTEITIPIYIMPEELVRIIK